MPAPESHEKVPSNRGSNDEGEVGCLDVPLEVSQSSHMPVQGLPEEGKLADALELLSGMLGRNPRYDHRGYRSQIRRHLKFRLKNMGIPIPEWLEDKG